MNNELTPKEIFNKRLELIRSFAKHSGCTVFDSEENLDLVVDVFEVVRKLFNKIGDISTNNNTLFINEQKLLFDVLTVVFGNLGVTTVNNEWAEDLKIIFTEKFLRYVTVFLEEN